MTDHLHSELTPGCYRCELNKDEFASMFNDVARDLRRRCETARDEDSDVIVDPDDVLLVLDRLSDLRTIVSNAEKVRHDWFDMGWPDESDLLNLNRDLRSALKPKDPA